MAKRVNKILWHGNEVNADGTPKPPSPATAADGLDGLNAGEVYIHEEDKAPAIYILTDAGRVVAIGGSDIETLAKTFLRKDQHDSTAYLLKLLGGAEFGEYLQGVSGGKIDANGAAELLSLVIRGLLTVDELRSKAFTSGALGSGFTLKIDDNGDSYLEIDRMLVRKVATFVELLIQELKHVGGQIILSPASMKCARVEDMGDYYRCYFENTDGDRTISQQFVTGDQARCQTFNIKEGVNENVTNTYYWRLVTGTGDDYIDLAKADCDAGSTVPQAGDEIVQLGNRTDDTRQGAIVLAAYGDDSPSIKLYKGINSYSLAGKEQISLSPQAVNIIADSLKFSTGENIKETITNAITGVDVEYALGDSQTVAPASGWSTTAPQWQEGKYMWQRTATTTATGTTYSDPTCIQGAAGPQGVPGEKGEDGKMLYTWIRYADNAQGSGISNNPTGKAFIGFAYNKDTPTESNNPEDYAWSEIKGEQGVPGEKGADGTQYYTWIAYSDNADGSGMYQQPNDNTKYIGIAVNKTTATESSNPADYTWSKFKGEEGVGVDELEEQYYLSNSNTTQTGGSWQNTCPTWQSGKYIWTRTKVTWTDGSISYTDPVLAFALNQALQDAQEANKIAEQAANRLDKWAEDGVISPTEKQGLKDEIARIKGDYDEINAQYAKYGLGTPSTYNSAYNSYLSVLTTLSASTPEVITIPSYFASRQTAYYTQRTAALNDIATAAKDYVDGLGDTVTETVMDSVDGKITLAVNTKVKDAQEEIMQEVNSQLQVLEGQISSKVSTTTFNEEKVSILNTAQGYANNALTSAKQDAANKYATISTMNTMSTRIDQLSNSISLKADSSTVTSLVNDYGDLQEHVADLETRVNSAELKITPDAIVTTVSGSLQVGYANMLGCSGNFGNSIAAEYWIDNGGGISIDTSNKYEGYNSIRTYIGNGIRYNKAIYLEQETEYCFSAMIKSTSNYTPAWNMLLHIQSWVNGSNKGVNYIEKKATLVANKWVLCYARFKLYSGATAIIPFIYDPDASRNINIAFLCLCKGNVPMSSWTPGPEDASSAMVQTANGFTFYGKTFDIKASIMTAENIAALNITTGKLTVTTGAKIGGWTVNGNALTCSQQAGAKIKVEPSGTRFLRINDTSTLMEMRADGVVGLSIYTQDTTGKCVNLMAQTGGIAMESHGNMELDARQGESIQLNGDVRAQGLALGTSIVGANYTVPYNVTFVSIQYGCTIKLPANPPTGRMVIFAARTADTITYQGNGKQIWRGSGISTSVRDEIDNCWNIFIYDSQRWVNIRLQNA